MTDTHLRTEQVGPVTVAMIGPEFDTIDEQALQHVSEFLLGLAADDGLKRLVIDLSETSFFGSGLLAIILRVYSRLQHRHGRLALCGLQPHCREVLQTTRLDTLWPIYETRSEGIAGLSRD